MAQSFLIVGMGTFGERAATFLYEGGAQVLVVDRDEDNIERVSPAVSRAVCAEGSNEEAMDAVGAFDVNVAIVALRHHFDSAVLITHMLRKREVARIMVQVDSELEAEAIRAIGATDVIFPERDMAERVGQKLLTPDLADQVPLGDGVGIIEAACPPDFADQSLIDLNLRRQFGINVIAIRRSAEDGREGDVEVAPPPDQPLTEGDTLIVIGKTDALSKFREALGQKANESQN